VSKTLKGKVALVTGGSRGLGAATAAALAAEGADVAISYVASASKAEAVVQELKKTGVRAIAIKSDQADPSAAKPLIDAVVAHFGKLDILVNNAAFQLHAASIEDITDERFDLTLKTNVFGYFQMARAAVPHLARARRSSTPALSPGWKEARTCSTTRPPREPSTRSPSRWPATCCPRASA
jgi:3-oxoacyl-[acyl-carrier protein] reductase